MSAPLPRQVRRLLAAYTLSCVGTGLIYPFTAIYLVTVRGLGAGTAGLFFGVIALVSFLTAPISGRLVDARDARRVAALGVVGQALGYGGLALAGSRPVALGCAVLVGLGNGAFYPGFTPVMAALLTPDQRKRAFARRYVAMNIGLGVGAALGGLLVHAVSGIGAFQVLYVVDATTFLPLAAAFLVGPRSRPAGTGGAGERGAGYRVLLRNRPLMVLLIAQTMLVAFGYSQLDSAIPLMLTQHVGVSAALVGFVIAVNTAAVVLLQVPLARRLERPRSSVLVAACALVWVGAYATAALATVVAGPAQPVLLLLFAVVFAVGETCYAVAFQPLLVELTPPSLLGRGSALSSLSWNAGATVGPALGIALVGLVAPVAYWAIYASALLAAACAALSLRAPARAKNARARPSQLEAQIP